MRIYTKTGDTGETSLFNGKRVPKDSEYIEAYGTVDELNSVIGVAIAHTKNKTIKDMLLKIQETLFQLGSDLATPFNDKTSKAQTIIHRISDADIKTLETWIDTIDAKLPPIKNFILPGGGICGAQLHLSRTICRRAERLLTPLVREGKANPRAFIYLNRLSDFLFVLARFSNQNEKIQEKIWMRS